MSDSCDADVAPLSCSPMRNSYFRILAVLFSSLVMAYSLILTPAPAFAASSAMNGSQGVPGYAYYNTSRYHNASFSFRLKLITTTSKCAGGAQQFRLRNSSSNNPITGWIWWHHSTGTQTHNTTKNWNPAGSQWFKVSGYNNSTCFSGGWNISFTGTIYY